MVFSPRALEDVEEAREWYNKQQKGFGKKLNADVQGILAAIKQIHISLPLNFIISELHRQEFSIYHTL